MKIDVPQLLTELAEAGYSDTEIRLRCGVRHRSTVSLWRSGRTPSLVPGLKLLLLHLQVFPTCSPLKTLLAVSLNPHGEVAGRLAKRGYVFEDDNERGLHDGEEGNEDSR